MPTTVTFERNNRVLVMTHTDPMDLREVAALQESLTREVLDKAIKPVYAIADCSAVTQLPSNVLSNGRKLVQAKHPMSSSMLFVADGMFIHMMATTFSRLVKNQEMVICKTLAEAWTYIDQQLAKEDDAAPLST